MEIDELLPDVVKSILVESLASIEDPSIVNDASVVAVKPLSELIVKDPTLRKSVIRFSVIQKKIKG